MKKNNLYVAVALLLFACHPKTENSEYLNVAQMDMVPPPPPPATLEMVRFAPPVIKDDALEEIAKPETAKTTTSTTKKIIKDGTLSIKTEKIEEAKRELDSVLKRSGAYYEKEEFENYEARIAYTLKVRVPAQHFETFLSAAEKSNGELMSKSVNARDVTEEYTDTEIRLNSKKLFRQRYNQLLAKAGKVSDMLEIEENIRVLQEEIESQEGRLKFLDDQVSYSTVDITLFKLIDLELPKLKEETFLQRVKGSLAVGWQSVLLFCLWCINQWPLILIGLICVIGLRRAWKKRKKNS